LLVVVPMGRCLLSHSCSIKLQRCNISFWTRSAIPTPIGSHPSQCYSSGSGLKFRVPMEHNCKNPKLTLLCWFKNMQITLLRAFRQYQNQSGGPTIWEDWYHSFVHVPTWHYKHQSHNKSYHSRNELQNV